MATPKKTFADARHEAFVRHYLIHDNASRAYREAGYKDGPGTRQSAHRLLTSAYIQARILEERQKLLAALDMTVEDVTRRFRNIAFADIADIVGLHYGACRYCFGIAHAYQWRTPREFKASISEARAECAPDNSEETQIHPEGGYGYDLNLPPNPHCPECAGIGIPIVVLKDTRLLTDAERAVFAGISKTRLGTHYRFNNQLRALKELAKRLGFYGRAASRETNVIGRLIREMQDRGEIQRMPLRRDQERKA
jgi:phage terminase small subunit